MYSVEYSILSFVEHLVWAFSKCLIKTVQYSTVQYSTVQCLRKADVREPKIMAGHLTPLIQPASGIGSSGY